MANIEVTPEEFVKLLVGESVDIRITFPQRRRYEVNLQGNFNGEPVDIIMEGNEDGYAYHVPLIKSGRFRYAFRFRREGTKRWYWYKDKNGNRRYRYIQVDPAWLSQTVVYNVFVRFFADHPDSNVTTFPKAPGGGTFDDVKAHLDELKDLHITSLYLNPIHLIGDLFRGYNMLDQLPDYLQPGSPYSIKDYKSIDPELTLDKDASAFALADPQQEFRDLIEAAHERGMFVFMDLVFNHTSHDFVLQRLKPEWYLYKDQITSLDDPYIYPEEVKDGKPWGDPRHTFSPYDHDTWWADCAQLNWEYQLPPGPNEPPPNYSLKEMWAYFMSIPQYWIKHFGVDGFRCDVAYRVPPQFWKQCIAEARRAARTFQTNISHDVAFIAESYENDLEALQKAGFSAVYGQYSHKLQKPIQLKGYLDYIYNIGEKHFPSGSRWFLFPESHDFSRTGVKVVGEDAAKDVAVAQRVNESRWLLTATLPGVPLIFNGFEKIEWRPINIMSYGAINWTENTHLRNYIEKVNRTRQTEPALQKGTYTYIPSNQGLDEQTQLFAYVRRYKDDTLLVVVNMDVYHQAGPAELQLPQEFNNPYTLTDLLTDDTYARKGTILTVIVPPGGGHLFRVNWKQ